MLRPLPPRNRCLRTLDVISTGIIRILSAAGFTPEQPDPLRMFNVLFISLMILFLFWIWVYLYLI